MMFERYLIENCAPTLASLKTANLFRYTYDTEEELQESVEKWNDQFAPKGVSVEILYRTKEWALVYVYRRMALERDLHRDGTEQLLEQCGYGHAVTVETAIPHLKTRLKANDGFPHEIGLFLGYPLEDVIGFIRNRGHNSKCTGYWKVYGDATEAVRTFAKFRKCQDVYGRLWKEGRRSVLQLTVAV